MMFESNVRTERLGATLLTLVAAPKSKLWMQQETGVVATQMVLPATLMVGVLGHKVVILAANRVLAEDAVALGDS